MARSQAARPLDRRHTTGRESPTPDRVLAPEAWMDDEGGLHAARGVAVGVAFGAIFWLLVGAAAYLITR